MQFFKSFTFCVVGFVAFISPFTHAQVTGNLVLLSAEDSITLGVINQILSLQTEHTSTTVIGYNFTSTTAASTSHADAIYFGPPVLERLPGFFFPNQSLIIREKFINQYVKGSDGMFKLSRQRNSRRLSPHHLLQVCRRMSLPSGGIVMSKLRH